MRDYALFPTLVFLFLWYNVETEENVSTIDSMCALAHETMV